MRKVFAIAFIIWSAGMVYLLLSPGTDMPDFELFQWQDKVAHFGLFSGWSFLLVVLIRKPNWHVFWFVLGIALIFGGVTEWLQAFIPHRSADILDFFVDIIGALVGIVAGFFVKKELFRAEKKFDK